MRHLPLVTMLFIAFAGALIALALDLPAAALIGGTIAVTAACAAGLPGDMPEGLRNFAFSIIGVTLGSGVSPTLLDDLARYSVSLLCLLISLTLTMVVASLVLVRRHAMPWPTALLGTSPGALSFALSMSEDLRLDTRLVMVLQSMRLLIIVLALPPVIALTDSGAAGSGISGHPATLGYLLGAVLVVLTLGLGWGAARIRIPASYLLAGVAVSGFVHWQGWAQGRLPAEMNLIGFAIAGAIVGGRFGAVPLASLRRFGTSSLITAIIGIGMSAASAAVLAPLLEMPFGQIWVAYAPGGVEAMASMALSLGYDPIYVASHHVVRLLALLAGLPLALRLIAPRMKEPQS